MQNQYLQQQLLYNIVKAREEKKSECAFVHFIWQHGRDIQYICLCN